MPPKKTETTVVPLLDKKYAKMTPHERLNEAQSVLYDAYRYSDGKQSELAQKALSISADCVGAYCILAEDTKDKQKKLALYRCAVEAGMRVLGEDWEECYRGHGWLMPDTRPAMQAMASLAMELEDEDPIECAALYNRLMVLNPTDNQGIRFRLSAFLMALGREGELDKLFKAFPDDVVAYMTYTKALHLFRKAGPTAEAKKALLAAYKYNRFVPLFLSDVVEMPFECPEMIAIGRDTEAIAYTLQHGGLWWQTPGANAWMAEVLGPEISKQETDAEMVSEVLISLKGKEIGTGIGVEKSSKAKPAKSSKVKSEKSTKKKAAETEKYSLEEALFEFLEDLEANTSRELFELTKSFVSTIYARISDWGEDENISRICEKSPPSVLQNYLDKLLRYTMVRELSLSEEKIEFGIATCLELCDWLKKKKLLTKDAAANIKKTVAQYEEMRVRARSAELEIDAAIAVPKGPRSQNKTIEYNKHDISRIEGDNIWLEIWAPIVLPKECLVGPIPLPKEVASTLAVGWIIRCELANTKEGWRIAKVGPIYPAMSFEEGK